MLRLRKYKCRHSSLAFTLIELLIVIGIAAIVLTIAVPAWRSYYLRIVTVSAANTLCVDLRYTRMMSLQRQHVGLFSYGGTGDYSRGLKAGTFYKCYAGAMRWTTGNSGIGYIPDNGENTIVTPLNKNIYFSSTANGTKLSSASIEFYSQGKVWTQKGFTKTAEGDYIIYVVCPGVISIPVKIMASGKIIAG